VRIPERVWECETSKQPRDNGKCIQSEARYGSIGSGQHKRGENRDQRSGGVAEERKGGWSHDHNADEKGCSRTEFLSVVFDIGIFLPPHTDVVALRLELM
jgi:hypothetical protein